MIREVFAASVVGILLTGSSAIANPITEAEVIEAEVTEAEIIEASPITETSLITETSPITEAEVTEAQRVWAEGIVAIGSAYLNSGDYEALASEHVDTLYAYDEGSVLFKPTKAAVDQFRLSEDEALSYFVGGIVDEDTGFALQPWAAVRFENANIITDADSAIAMGNYFFTDSNTGDEVKVEYTFGYVRGDDGNLLINVHHSALPYAPAN